MHAYGDPITDARVMDLFAGTGALGLEALSRGAKFALFVEETVEARGIIRENIETLGVIGMSNVFRRDAAKLGPRGPVDPFDLVFCDPPYGQGLAEKALAGARTGGWLNPGALVVIEDAVAPGFKTSDGFKEVERRRYDETEVVFLRLASAPTE